MMIYTLSGLTKVYNSRTVLDIPGLELEKGAIYGLLGPNGAGKTTLLNILAFLEPPTSGSLTFDGAPVSDSVAHLRNLRKRVVMLDQHPILFSTTVYKNLEFPLKIRKIPHAKRRQMIEEALTLVGMTRFAQAQGHRLSGGETQRAAIARALVTDPEVFLCDEPTASVDLEHQAVIMNILRQINARKKITILFTTHDWLQAASLAQHTLFLDQGKIETAPRENIFAAQLKPVSDNGMECIVQSRVRFKLTQTEAGRSPERARIFIDPEKISLLKAESEPPLANGFSGRVIQLAEMGEKIRVRVDIGILITLRLSKETYRQNPPAIGEAAYIALAPDAIQILQQ